MCSSDLDKPNNPDIPNKPDDDVVARDEVSLYLLAGQSNMVGSTDGALYKSIMDALKSGSEQERSNAVEAVLNDWYENYQDGYARYAASPEVSEREAEEIVRLQTQGVVGSHLFKERHDVLCRFQSPIPRPLTNNCGGGTSFGPELTLGEILGNRFTNPVAFVKVAKGGSTLQDDWLSPSAAAKRNRPLGPWFKELQKRVQELQTKPENIHPDCKHRDCTWRGFIWFQGENDSTSESAAAEYESNLKDLVKDVRAELGKVGLPVTIIQIGHWARNDLGHGKLVHSAQSRVAAADSKISLVRTDDLSRFFHYDPAAQLIIGHRVAQKISN